MGRIVKIDTSITFEQFKEQYKKHFPISKENTRVKAMADEYKRLTGRDAEEPVQGPPVKRRRNSKWENSET
jgi:hypothetical protein